MNDHGWLISPYAMLLSIVGIWYLYLVVLGVWRAPRAPRPPRIVFPPPIDSDPPVLPTATLIQRTRK